MALKFVVATCQALEFLKRERMTLQGVVIFTLSKIQKSAVDSEPKGAAEFQKDACNSR